MDFYFNNLYHMYFSYRHNYNYHNTIRGYRIGYATSHDGISWVRADKDGGIPLSKSGWDSEMQHYPHVFDVDGSHYMLYNGNDFGRYGLGLANSTTLSLIANNTNALNIFSNGNVGINTLTNAGYLFDVSGTSVFRGALNITATGLQLVGSTRLWSNNDDTVIMGSLANRGTKFLGAGFGTQQGYIEDNGMVIGSNTRATSAKLDVQSITQGLLIPRMTTTQKNAISSPVEGLKVYDLTLHKECVYTGSVWETITSI